MYEMSHDQWREFVQQGTRTGKVAVTRADGSPHVTPVWFVLDSADDTDVIVFTTGTHGVKARALRRDPRFALSVDDQLPPYSFVLLEARATLSEDPAELLRWATAVGGRYMGADRAEEFGRRNGAPGEYLVRGRVTRAIAVADLAG